MLCLVMTGMTPLSTVRAHESYHTFYTHLDPVTAIFILCCAVGVPLFVHAIGKRRRPARTAEPDSK